MLLTPSKVDSFDLRLLLTSIGWRRDHVLPVDRSGSGAMDNFIDGLGSWRHQWSGSEGLQQTFNN